MMAEGMTPAVDVGDVAAPALEEEVQMPEATGDSELLIARPKEREA